MSSVCISFYWLKLDETPPPPDFSRPVNQGGQLSDLPPSLHSSTYCSSLFWHVISITETVIEKENRLRWPSLLANLKLCIVFFEKLLLFFKPFVWSVQSKLFTFISYYANAFFEKVFFAFGSRMYVLWIWWISVDNSDHVDFWEGGLNWPVVPWRKKNQAFKYSLTPYY